MTCVRQIAFVCVLCCISFFSAGAKAAFPILIDVGDYEGFWDILGETNGLTGDQTIPLDPGSYFVRIARRGESAVLVDVDANGNVTSNNTAAMAASGSTLTFNTTTLTVDPGALNGPSNFWDVLQVTGGLLGLQNVTVVPNLSYFVRVGRRGESSVLIDVDANGDATSNNTAAMSTAGSTVTFNTTTLTVDPGAYSGPSNFWDILQITGGLLGVQSIPIVPNLSYYARVARRGESSVLIDIDANGNVNSNNTAAMTASGSTLTFNTTTLTVNPGNYNGPSNFWDVLSVTSGLVGIQLVTVVPNLSYYVRVARRGESSVLVNVDANGDVVSNNPAAMTASGSTLTFNTTSLIIDPGAFNRSGDFWDVLSVTSGLTGSQSITIVPALSYFVRVGRSSVGAFRVDIDANGDATSQNSAAASTTDNIVTFNTTTVNVTPSNNDFWKIINVDPSNFVTGARTATLVPGLGYQFQNGTGGGVQTFTVAEPCAVNPNQLILGAAIFDLTCGAPDSDDDGVPDDTDNCPDDPNPDQIDQDLDGFGNVCDPDLDGDLVGNLTDNCPDIANTDQADGDGDGAGDVCDSDDDNDSVPDLVDNCPIDPNTDQADNDNDLAGDVCDEDDDNDAVADLIDNCPLTANADQVDFDGNGQGDVCDGDIDGDNVANTADLCPLTPQGKTVNSDGCNGPQFIAFTCARENFVQHGQYVSCVAHAANDAVNQGLLTPNERSRFVKEAAKK